MSAEGSNVNTFNDEGICLATGTLFDEDGYDIHGYSEKGYDREGFDKYGHKEEFYNSKRTLLKL